MSTTRIALCGFLGSTLVLVASPLSFSAASESGDALSYSTSVINASPDFSNTDLVAPRTSPLLNQNTLNREIENFTVGEINGQREFTVTLGTLVPLREYLTESTANIQFADTVLVGKIRNGSCQQLFRQGQGTWSEGRASTRTNRIIKLNMNVNVDGRRYWNVGTQPCVRRVVTWEWPEQMTVSTLNGTNYADLPTSARSDIRLTPNTIPPRGEVPAPPQETEEVEEVVPSPETIDPELGDFDPDLLNGPEIVLPDFFVDENGTDDVETLLANVANDPNFNADAVRGALQNLRVRFRELAGWLGLDASNGQSPSDDNSIQRDALINASRNPDAIANAIASSRADINTARVISNQSTDPAAAQVVDLIDVYEDQLENFANTAPVRVSGGVVTAETVGSSVGFNTTQSPVAGLSGNGSVSGLSMKLISPKTVKRGGKANVRVSLNPKSTKGVVRLAIIRKSGSGLQKISTKNVPVRNGKAIARLPISKKASKGTYTLIASLVPSTRSDSGITVQIPIAVR